MREGKRCDLRRWEEAGRGAGYQVVQVPCSLASKVCDLDAQEDAALLKAQMNKPFTEAPCLGRDHHQGLPVSNLSWGHPGRLLALEPLWRARGPLQEGTRDLRTPLAQPQVEQGPGNPQLRSWEGSSSSVKGRF